MIKIKTTPNIYGISLIGDYQDLHELWESIGNYLQFFIDNNEEYPYHEYEYLLALNYDIRHAFMGCRGISIEKNNAEAVGEIAQSIYEIPPEAKEEFYSIRKSFKEGNLYFQVEILYPLVFHYMIALGLILDDFYLPEWFENENNCLKSYDKLDMEHDRSVIQHFISLLWNNLKDLFGKETALALFEYYENCEAFYLQYMYTDALVHCQLANFEDINPEQKKHFLMLSLFELMDSGMLLDFPKKYSQQAALYQEALIALKTKEKKDRELIPLKEAFFTSLENNFPADKPIYEDDFDAFLSRTYGEVAEEEPEW